MYRIVRATYKIVIIRKSSCSVTVTYRVAVKNNIGSELTYSRTCTSIETKSIISAVQQIVNEKYTVNNAGT